MHYYSYLSHEETEVQDATKLRLSTNLDGDGPRTPKWNGLMLVYPVWSERWSESWGCVAICVARLAAAATYRKEGTSMCPLSEVQIERDG